MEKGMMQKVGKRNGKKAPAHGAFTLIELLIIIAVIALIAAMSIPIFLSARHKGYESDAIACLKSLYTAQEQYRMRDGKYGTLDELRDAELIQFDKIAGYTLNFQVDKEAGTWNAQVVPQANLDILSYYIDRTAVIRYEDNGPAGPASPAL
jgi:type II secretory pathway pseudopilin PulG